MLKVMFLCTGNSCRSQLAEGLARHYGAGIIGPYSVGRMPAGVSPYAIRVMREIGIDITGQTSDSIDEVFVEEDGCYYHPLWRCRGVVPDDTT